MVNGRRTAFIERFSNRWPVKALYDTASHSPIHAHADVSCDSQLTGEQLGARCLAQGTLPRQLHSTEEPGSS